MEVMLLLMTLVGTDVSSDSLPSVLMGNGEIIYELTDSDIEWMQMSEID